MHFCIQDLYILMALSTQVEFIYFAIHMKVYDIKAIFKN
jgi:hypothetical protein